MGDGNGNLQSSEEVVDGLASETGRVHKRDLKISSTGLTEASSIYTQIRKCQEDNITSEALTLFLGNQDNCVPLWNVCTLTHAAQGAKRRNLSSMCCFCNLTGVADIMGELTWLECCHGEIQMYWVSFEEREEKELPFMWEQQECVGLSLYMDDEPVGPLPVRIWGQTSKGNIMGVCCIPPN